MILRAGKFCHSILGFEAGQVTIYGASKVQAIDWLIPVSNHTGIGKRPSNWRKTICWRASVVMESKSKLAAARESRCSKNP